MGIRDSEPPTEPSAVRHRAFLALGANLGARAATLRRAAARLDRHPHVRVQAASPVYETAALTLRPEETQPPYLNAVVEVATRLAPGALLRLAHGIEAALGRDRRGEPRWAARTLDLDLLLYDDLVVTTPDLILPHPRLAERAFVLRPLADLAPHLVVPGLAATVADLLARLPDRHAPQRTAVLLKH